MTVPLALYGTLAGCAGVERAAGGPRAFNVLDYGAVGDDKTDNTRAFSDCLNAIVEAGGGRMFLPDGVYRGRITVPGVSGTRSWITIEITGESEPTHVFGTIGNFPLQHHGTILRCTSRDGPPAIGVARPAKPLYGGFSAVCVVIRNLDVRTGDDPAIGGIDLEHALQCRLENVFINTGVYNVQASEPTHGTAGLITPAINNAARTVLRHVTVTGYHTGIVVNEHTDAADIVVASNLHGLRFVRAHHASHFGRVGVYRNAHHIAVAGPHGFRIAQLNTEQPGRGQTHDRNAWQAKRSDVHDPKDFGFGDIDYWVVVGGVGARDDFSRTGGRSIRVRRIGTASGR